MATPFSLTKEEQKMVERDYKKPKARKYPQQKKVKLEETETDIAEKMTEATMLKQKMSKEISEFWENIEEEEEEEEEDPSAGVEGMAGGESKESLSSFVKSSRKMFLLQYALEVKMGEKTRLETTIREEEARVKKEEADLKLAEQARGPPRFSLTMEVERRGRAVAPWDPVDDH